MGGAIVSSSNSGIKDLYIVNSTFNHNRAQGGGAINVVRNNRVTILDSSFYENEATEHSGGALVVSDSTLIMDNVTMTSNSASYGGGAISSWNTDATITNSIISGNMANSVGGGIYFRGSNLGGHPSSSLTILNSTISNNIGFDSGGAFYIGDASVRISNSNIFDNFAPSSPTIAITPSNLPPINIFELDNNWWGSDLGPTDDVWRYADNFRNWKRTIITWEEIGGGGSYPVSGNGDEGTSSNPWYNPNYGNGNGGSGGIRFGSGTGTTIGSGGIGFGDGFGSGIWFGNGNGYGSHGFIPGSNGSNRGNATVPSGNGTVVWNNVGTMGLTAVLGSSVGGGSVSSGSGSSGRAYELNEEKNSRQVEDSDLLVGLLAVLFIMALVILGYLRNRRSG